MSAFTESLNLQELLTIIYQLINNISIDITSIILPITNDNKKKFRLLEYFLKFLLYPRTMGDIFGYIGAVDYTPENLETCINNTLFQEFYQGDFFDYVSQIHKGVVSFRSGKNKDWVINNHLNCSVLPIGEWNSFIDKDYLSLICFEVFIDCNE